ncbi:RlmF-related methyltransferase [Pseudomonas sp. SL4(2022)]|nr:RlmF-related methyltransferase [Pseudomonas sp. SL4(2022)]WAC43247.1 RlmF-related methyltransferase [Pseudomonas sp. SL4(2022)]
MAQPRQARPQTQTAGAELWRPGGGVVVQGGEAAFVSQLIKESAEIGQQVLWFSSLISKAGNLPGVYSALKKAGALQVQTVEMAQGQKQSRFVAWTFHTAEQQQRWRQNRWQ